MKPKMKGFCSSQSDELLWLFFWVLKRMKSRDYVSDVIQIHQELAALKGVFPSKKRQVPLLTSVPE